MWKQRFSLVYLALTALLVSQVASSRDPQTGFTRLVVFGDRFAPHRLSKLRNVSIYTYTKSDGYDGQFYAQLAVAGNPLDPELRTALDAPEYRSGRILLPELAYVAGLGRPAWVLCAYALSNLVCWLILAWTTARWWFPPTSFDNLVRWGGTLFGAGMLASMARSLTDGPALVFIAMGMRLLESNRRALAAVAIGAAGLVREGAVLAAGAFVSPLRSTANTWPRQLFTATACVLPAVLWSTFLFVHYGSGLGGPSGTALGWPVVALFKEGLSIGSVLVRTRTWRAVLSVKDDAFVLLAMVTQIAYLLLRPRPKLAFWRVGVAFALLALFSSSVGWADATTALPRTYLPMTLAFNLLVPRTRGGLALLLAGNLTVLSAPLAFDVIPTEQTLFVGGITCDYESGWYQSEHHGSRTWRWSSGSARIIFHNPSPKSIPVEVAFEMSSPAVRTVELRASELRQAVTLPAEHRVSMSFGPLALAPGDTSLAFDTDGPPWKEPGVHGRALTFSVQNLRVTSPSSSSAPR